MGRALTVQSPGTGLWLLSTLVNAGLAVSALGGRGGACGASRLARLTGWLARHARHGIRALWDQVEKAGGTATSGLYMYRQMCAGRPPHINTNTYMHTAHIDTCKQNKTLLLAVTKKNKENRRNSEGWSLVPHLLFTLEMERQLSC